MKKRDYRDYLCDIIQSIRDIEVFTEDMAYEKFIKDKRTINAVVRSIEIIGEAAKNIPSATRSIYKNVPWREMAGMRDKVIHEYFGVDLDIVWKTIKLRLPGLKKELNIIYKKEIKK